MVQAWEQLQTRLVGLSYTSTYNYVAQLTGIIKCVWYISFLKGTWSRWPRVKLYSHLLWKNSINV